MNSVLVIPSVNVPPGIYNRINSVKGHHPKKIGSTNKITEALHNIDIKHAEVRRIDQQDFCYRTALFFGIESIAYPYAKRDTTLNPNEPYSTPKSRISPKL